MIIVEGPDGAGKTTLIKQLSERYGLPIAPRVVSKDTEAMVDLKAWVEENVQLGWQDVIFDRYRLISETIYGPVLRKKQHEGFTDWAWFTTQLTRFYRANPIVIYCLPPLEVVRENISGDESNRRVWDTIEQIYAGYVTRSALDYETRPKTTHIWDYTRDFMFEGPDPLHYFDLFIPPLLKKA